MSHTDQTYNTSLHELYYILNNDVVPHYNLRNMFWNLFDSFEDGELEEMGVSMADVRESSITREVAYEHFSTLVINKIIEQHLKYESDPWVIKLNAKFKKTATESE